MGPLVFIPANLPEHAGIHTTRPAWAHSYLSRPICQNMPGYIRLGRHGPTRIYPGQSARTCQDSYDSAGMGPSEFIERSSEPWPMSDGLSEMACLSKKYTSNRWSHSLKGLRMDVTRVTYWSKIDMSDTYEQICIEPDNVWKTAVATVYGTFVSHVMQQGDCSTPTTFQRLITVVFCKHIGMFVHILLYNACRWCCAV